MDAPGSDLASLNAARFFVHTSAEGLAGAFTHRLSVAATARALATIGMSEAAALLRRAAARPAGARTLMDARMQACDAGLVMQRDRLRERLSSAASRPPRANS